MSAARVHVKRLLNVAASIQRECEHLTGPRKPSTEGAISLYDVLITEAELVGVTGKLFREGHYALAVEEAYKLLNNAVKARSGSQADGSSLMKNTFSLNNPRLRLNKLKTESQRNQQLGYMEIMSGCMTGIRNPRAHEHSYIDEPSTALEMLVWANHLLRMLGRATRCRKKRNKKANP